MHSFWRSALEARFPEVFPAFAGPAPADSINRMVDCSQRRHAEPLDKNAGLLPLAARGCAADGEASAFPAFRTGS